MSKEERLLETLKSLGADSDSISVNDRDLIEMTRIGTWTALRAARTGLIMRGMVGRWPGRGRLASRYKLTYRAMEAR
jgi:hypothetical protein